MMARLRHVPALAAHGAEARGLYGPAKREQPNIDRTFVIVGDSYSLYGCNEP